MNQFEKNIIMSFKLVKSDVLRLQNKIIELANSQKKLIEKLDSLKTKEVLMNEKIREINTTKTAPKIVTHHKKKLFVGSKEGKKFHLDNCPFAQNIKPKTKVTFHSKTKALNQGYKPCHCIK